MFAECILLVLLLLALIITLLVSFIQDGAELGVQVELAFKGIKGGGHCHNLVV